MKRNWVVVAACLLVALTGCSSKSQATAVKTNSSFTSISPIQDFMQGKDLANNFSSIQEEDVATCMQKKGWTYTPAVSTDQDIVQPTNPQALLDWRKKYGFGLLNQPGATSASTKVIVEQQQAYRDALSADAKARYDKDLGIDAGNETGKSPSGCRGQVSEQLQKSFPEKNPAVEGDIIQQQQGVQADPAFLTAANQWTSCMTAAGYHYSDYKGPHEEFSDDFSKGENTPELKAKEIQVAVADWQCSDKTLWPVQYRLESAIVQNVVDKYGKAATCRNECN